MQYSPERKRDMREKILESARRLFNRKGYSSVSIEEIMSDAGLTHGGFYRHFSSKEELHAAAVRQFLCTKIPPVWQKQRKPNRVTKSCAERTVDAYFSRKHFADHEGCCPKIGMACAFPTAGTRSRPPIRKFVEKPAEVFEGRSEPTQRRESRARARRPMCRWYGACEERWESGFVRRDFRRAAYAEVLRTAGWIETNSSHRQIRRSERAP
jgi:TetR/AcrR family transcriptional regulator, transcriptional repressor for nem operon